MGIVENRNPESILESEALPGPRKPLSPAFRMALLTGALESVRLHLRTVNHIDDADDRGRSALILAASKGHLEICKLLLEAGANPSLKDSEGNDARSLALLRGRTEVAALLRGAGTRDITEPESRGDQTIHVDLGIMEPNTLAISIAGNAKVSDRLACAEGLDINSDNETSKHNAFTPILPDEDGMFDLSGWQEDIASPPPPDDPTCAHEAGVLQAAISRHVPTDTDENWDDVEIDLPELDHLSRRRLQLSDDARQSLRSLLIEALRDGRVRAPQIENVLPDDEGIEDDERTEIKAAIHFVLGDIGTITDDNFLAPDTGVGIDEEDDETFGELATDAVNYVGRLLSNETDPLALFMKSLPSVQLTRDEEAALGMAVQEGRHEMLTAITASPSALSRLLSDSEAVLRGQLPARAMLDSPPGNISGEDALADEAAEDEETVQEEAAQEIKPEQLASEVAAHLTEIADLCRQAERNQGGLAQRLFAAELSSGYLAELEEIATLDADAVSAKERINAALAKAEQAKKRLVEANFRLVIWVAKRYGGLTLMDRIQEGNIGLMRAADLFDPRIGAKFSSYAVWWIRQSIARAVADAGRIIRIPVHVHENLRRVGKARLQAQYETGREPDTDRIAVLAKFSPETVRKLMKVPEDPFSVDSEPEAASHIGRLVGEETSSPDTALLASGTKTAANQHLGCLEPREERVIRLRFGMGCDEHTLEQIGQMYGITRERIRQIEAKALKKLGHPGRIKRLRDELR